ncbi:GxxExxY protein [soil metagenome]
MKASLERKDLLYPELSYKIIGCAFEVFNQIGPGLMEKNYQKALSVSFQESKINFKEQAGHNLLFHNTKVGCGYFDFLVEESIIVEIKRGKFYFGNELQQVNRYLRLSNLQLAIIIRFTPEGVRYKRVVNIPTQENEIP